MNLPEFHRSITDIRQVIETLQQTISQWEIRAQEEVLLSFVSPCYNEAENLRNLCARIHATCDANRITKYEIILVENGSADASEEIMRELHGEDRRVKMIQLSRNYGFQGAIACGLAYSRGQWVAVLDADLQDPPELIPGMLDKAREGFEIVYGVRIKRQENLWKRTSYKLFYRFWKMTSEIQVPLDAGDFGIMHRAVVDTINRMPERQRFMRGLRAFSGFRQTGFPYERQGRAAGESKFDLFGMLSLAVDGILSYSVVPLRIMMAAGSLIMLLTMLLSSIQVGIRLAESAGWVSSHLYPPGFAQINLLISFLAGFNILCTGLVGEYVGRIYKEVKQRPNYIVREFLL